MRLKILKNFGQKVEDVVVRRLHTNAGTNEKLYETKENVRRACLYPWERIVLTAKGMLSYCPTDWFGKAVIWITELILSKISGPVDFVTL